MMQHRKRHRPRKTPIPKRHLRPIPIHHFHVSPAEAFPQRSRQPAINLERSKLPHPPPQIIGCQPGPRPNLQNRVSQLHSSQSPGHNFAQQSPPPPIRRTKPMMHPVQLPSRFTIALQIAGRGFEFFPAVCSAALSSRAKPGDQRGILPANVPRQPHTPADIAPPNFRPSTAPTDATAAPANKSRSRPTPPQ